MNASVDLRLVGIAEAAEMTNLSPDTLRRACAKGELQYKRIGKVFKIRVASLEAWVLGLPQPDILPEPPANVRSYRPRRNEVRVK
jgi:excisionase family DNA binding protein